MSLYFYAVLGFHNRNGFTLGDLSSNPPVNALMLVVYGECPISRKRSNGLALI